MSQHYLLDTNILSELMRPRPDSNVLAWFERQMNAVFATSTITQAEVLLGIALLPAGKRRNDLANTATRMFQEDFSGLCLPFDEQAANEYAILVAARTRSGHPISTEDGQIAAIALAHDLLLVTRNSKDFTGITGLDMTNPWDYMKYPG
jgi:predicted nucleic acid-binding protein